MPLPQLRYAQVIKTVRRRRLVRVTHRVVFGTLEAVQQVLAAQGWQINTAFIERGDPTIRQHVPPLGDGSPRCARVRTAYAISWPCITCTIIAAYLTPVYANPCSSLSRPHGMGSAKRWRPRTPAMAAGLTEHVWTPREVLCFRVPPWPHPVGV
jgi:hypothetical protein